MSLPDREPPAAEQASCTAQALGGWSPPAMPADTMAKRLVDRLLMCGAAWCVMVAIVLALLYLAAHLPQRAALALDGLAALLAGAMCSANFWRCRHAHCLINGVGWLPLSILAFAGAAVGHSLIGGWEQTVFLATLLLALAFEGGWYLTTGTNALSPRGALNTSGRREHT
jgi:hypothetical protein